MFKKIKKKKEKDKDPKSIESAKLIQFNNTK